MNLPAGQDDQKTGWEMASYDNWVPVSKSQEPGAFPESFASTCVTIQAPGKCRQPESNSKEDVFAVFLGYNKYGYRCS
jgi:hypothetical protein